MSLRLRLILLLLLVNVALLGIAQLASWRLQREWLESNREIYERRVWDEVLWFAYGDYRVRDPEIAAATVRRVMSPELRSKLRTYYRDVLITSGATASAAVDLNPMGGHRRDPDAFPMSEIRDGIRIAMEERTLARAADGFCLPIVVEGTVVGGAWFEPILPLPPQVPLSVFAIPLLGGTIVFGLLVSLVIARALVRPLRRIELTARRFGEGRYDSRIAEVKVPEFDVFIQAFNAMAERIEGHHQELAREVRRATEEAQRKERAMLQSARLASMGTLAAGIAHEINNPIGGMLNALRRIGRNEYLTDREQVYVGLIQDGLERVGGIARRVLDFSPRNLEAQPFAVADAVEGARALVEHRIRAQGVEMSIDVPADLPKLVGDRHEFQQVVLNVLINSLDVLEGHPAPRRVEVTASRVGDGVELVVADNGPGMRREDLPQVMDPFYSGKGRPESSGLGMFISYSIVRNHGGDIEVESALGQGFVVRISMPGAELG